MLGDSWSHQALGPLSPGQLPFPIPATQVGFKPRYEQQGCGPSLMKCLAVLAQG